MAKVSGLMSSGKIGKADQKVVDAMPDAPAAALDSSTPVDVALEAPTLDSSTTPAKTKKSTELDSSALKAAVTELAVALVRPSPYQVRAVADSDYIETLMASIVQSGVISPVVVRMLDSSNYEVIAGHHRLEACRRLGYAKCTGGCPLHD
jgi:ParB family chromosome partitioning protein